jgi:hypothetical protein
MSPSPNSYSVPDENGQPEYHWTDGGEDGIAWQEDGNWKLQASYDLWQRHEVGHAHSVQHALDKADEVLDEFMLDRQIKDVGPAETRTVGESDLRNVVNWQARSRIAARRSKPHSIASPASWNVPPSIAQKATATSFD